MQEVKINNKNLFMKFSGVPRRAFRLVEEFRREEGEEREKGQNVARHCLQAAQAESLQMIRSN